MTQNDTNNAPKYTIKGNTIEEMALDFATLVRDTQTVAIVDRAAEGKKGGGKYGLWELGGSNDGLTLTGRQLELKTADGLCPLALGMTIAFKKLTPKAEYDNAQATRKAATASRVERLKAQLASMGVKVA